MLVEERSNVTQVLMGIIDLSWLAFMVVFTEVSVFCGKLPEVFEKIKMLQTKNR